MILSTIKLGCKVRVIAANHYGKTGHVTDLSIKLIDNDIRFVTVTVRIGNDDVNFFIEQVEHIAVADIRAGQLKAAA